MPNTPGNAPPSANRLDAFMRSRSPSAEIGKFNQDPAAAAVMQWLATPEAQEFLRRIVMEKGLMDQAIDRAHRIGQTQTVTVTKVICEGSLDEWIMRSASGKKKMQTLLLAASRKQSRS